MRTKCASRRRLGVSADLKVPGTSLEIPVELSVFVDSEGSPGVGGTVTILFP
jgi:hypothetical protein